MPSGYEQSSAGACPGLYPGASPEPMLRGLALAIAAVIAVAAFIALLAGCL